MLNKIYLSFLSLVIPVSWIIGVGILSPFPDSKQEDSNLMPSALPASDTWQRTIFKPLSLKVSYVKTVNTGLWNISQDLLSCKSKVSPSPGRWAFPLEVPKSCVSLIKFIRLGKVMANTLCWNTFIFIAWQQNLQFLSMFSSFSSPWPCIYFLASWHHQKIPCLQQIIFEHFNIDWGPVPPIRRSGNRV